MYNFIATQQLVFIGFIPGGGLYRNKGKNAVDRVTTWQAAKKS